MATWFRYGIKDSIVAAAVVADDDHDDYDGGRGDRERAQIASLRLHVTHIPTAHATHTCDRTNPAGAKRRGGTKGDRGLLEGG